MDHSRKHSFKNFLDGLPSDIFGQLTVFKHSPAQQRPLSALIIPKLCLRTLLTHVSRADTQKARGRKGCSQY